jgi:hypothetical protein
MSAHRKGDCFAAKASCRLMWGTAASLGVCARQGGTELWAHVHVVWREAPPAEATSRGAHSSRQKPRSRKRRFMGGRSTVTHVGGAAVTRGRRAGRVLCPVRPMFSCLTVCRIKI